MRLRPFRSALIVSSLLLSMVGCAEDNNVAGAPRDTGVGRTDGSVTPGTDGGTGGTSGLPCDVSAVLTAQCTSCHGPTPIAGAPISLASYADLTAPSRVNPAVTNAELSVTRMMSATAPMPPAPAAHASDADIATLQSWITAGMPMGTCTSPTDPYGTPVMCSSGTTWTRGNRGSELMRPGGTCITCHATMGEGPDFPFTLAGTVYPTAHEPDDCNGTQGTSTVEVVITGADGATITLSPNSVGNFFYDQAIALPYTAAVHYEGRTRAMTTPQTEGDCNVCHTESGAMSAPGRIMLP